MKTKNELIIALENWVTDLRGKPSAQEEDFKQGLLLFFQLLKAHNPEGIVDIALTERLMKWMKNSYVLKNEGLKDEIRILMNKNEIYTQKVQVVKGEVKERLAKFEQAKAKLGQQLDAYRVWNKKNLQLSKVFDDEHPKEVIKIEQLLKQARNNLRLYDERLIELRKEIIEK